MSEEFPAFAKVVACAFQKLTETPNVFVALVDSVFGEYLGAFPAGTDPLFKKNSEHNCACCRHFVRRVGGVVTIGDDGELSTIWDDAAQSSPEPYRTVALHMQKLVRAAPVVDLFRVGESEASFGVELSRSLNKESGKAETWKHFHTGPIARALRVRLPDQVRGDYRTTVAVFERGLVELSPDAVQTVLSLIESNALYRGEEHKSAVLEFLEVQRGFLASRDKWRFVWANAGSHAARFRNTVIGTLVQDLSEGKDLEVSVSSFETKVAPQNYKRTTALITPAMVKKAMTTIADLGLEPALERRFAVLSDVSVNDVKWVDGGARPLMKNGGIGGVLMKHAESSRVSDGAEDRAVDIGLDELVSKVLPEATGLDIFFKGEHIGNLVSLTAPVHPEPAHLFRWDNDFAWSYGGNVADSIKERVKRAGGKVEGVALRASLSWFNYDDLDIHIHEPAGRGSRGLSEHIYYANRVGWTGGELDVDMNAGSGRTREPVENVVWERSPPDGTYRIVVNNYCRRESADPGFVVEVECGGKLSHFSYSKGVRDRSDVSVVSLHITSGRIERLEVLDPAITAANISQEKWGLRTEQYVRVSAVVLSPNYWNGSSVGNKHTFFLLEGAKNDEPTRGFYNEFLHPRLVEHRKVFEVIADKTKCPPSDTQLSGLGFSSTLHTTFLVRAYQGKRQRVYNVKVGV